MDIIIADDSLLNSNRKVIFSDELREYHFRNRTIKLLEGQYFMGHVPHKKYFDFEHISARDMQTLLYLLLRANIETRFHFRMTDKEEKEQLNAFAEQFYGDKTVIEANGCERMAFATDDVINRFFQINPINIIHISRFWDYFYDLAERHKLNTFEYELKKAFLNKGAKIFEFSFKDDCDTLKFLNYAQQYQMPTYTAKAKTTVAHSRDVFVIPYGIDNLD